MRLFAAASAVDSGNLRKSATAREALPQVGQLGVALVGQGQLDLAAVGALRLVEPHDDAAALLDRDVGHAGAGGQQTRDGEADGEQERAPGGLHGCTGPRTAAFGRSRRQAPRRTPEGPVDGRCQTVEI